MPARARGIRLGDVLEREIEREAEWRGKSWSATTAELLTEAIRMRRAPGVIFADGQMGRRALVSGTGLEVWEIVATWKEGGCSFQALREDHEWLSEAQLRAALSYYELYPEEIDARLERERRWAPETVRKELPFSRLSESGR
ncbi:DUF433 domain-containing protein [Candidatus Fermentibacteria bacterium]|nr:DUF433 domain-containing protein [Candidatus Fermentibacteria bacterium]